MGELIHGATILLTVFDIPENSFLTSKFSVPGFNLGNATPLCEPDLVWHVDDVHPKSTNDFGDWRLRFRGITLDNDEELVEDEEDDLDDNANPVSF
jgi:hypothetical protein